jgi:Tfp pilus assembly protein PilF
MRINSFFLNLGHSYFGEAAYQEALTYMKDRLFEQAICRLNYALMTDLKNAQYWATRGQCYAALFLYPLALNDYHRALELDPENKNLIQEHNLIEQKNRL